MIDGHAWEHIEYWWCVKWKCPLLKIWQVEKSDFSRQVELACPKLVVCDSYNIGDVLEVASEVCQEVIKHVLAIGANNLDDFKDNPKVISVRWEVEQNYIMLIFLSNFLVDIHQIRLQGGILTPHQSPVLFLSGP